MSHPVRDRLRELEADVRHLPVQPAAAVRARGRRRGRRQVAAWTTACAVVAVTAGVAFAWPHQRTAPVPDRPGGSAGVSCVLALPDSPAKVRVRVLDGGAAPGILDAAAADLRDRRFVVLAGATGVQQSVDAATVRYGPASIGAASLVRAFLRGAVTMSFDPERREETVDVTLGPAFPGLATTIEVNQNLVTAGLPSAPPQCSTTVSRPR